MGANCCWSDGVLQPYSDLIRPRPRRWSHQYTRPYPSRRRRVVFWATYSWLSDGISMVEVDPYASGVRLGLFPGGLVT